MSFTLIQQVHLLRGGYLVVDLAQQGLAWFLVWDIISQISDRLSLFKLIDQVFIFLLQHCDLNALFINYLILLLNYFFIRLLGFT